MNRYGWRHWCGPSPQPADQAFRRWADALEAANEIGRLRMQAEIDRARRAGVLR